MKKKRHSLFVLLFLILVSSCSAEQDVKMNFEKSIYKTEPGETSEILCNVSFNKNEKPDKKNIKRFQEEPEIKVSDKDIIVLSCTPDVSENAVNCLILIKTPEIRLSGKSCSLKISWGGFSAKTELLTKKNPLKYINSNGIITDAESIDALINKKRSLPANYIPPDLVKIDVATVLEFEEVNLLRNPASKALSNLVKSAKEDGYEILARSGYRSYKTQKNLFDYYVKRDGEKEAKKFSAIPGTSEHQSGLAVDVTSPIVNNQLVQSYGETPEGLWLENNAHRFGFIIRYQKNKQEITGYAYEPWHLRYIGKEAATQIYNQGLCLEEYFK